MTLILKVLTACLLVSSFVLTSNALGHTLLIESSKNKEMYFLNGVNTPLGELLDAATEMVVKESQSPVVIIFDSTVSLDVVLNARGIFNKAGFQAVTLFARWKKTGKMCEVSLGAPVPFELNPPPPTP